MVAEVVAFIGRAPERTSGRIDCFTNTVPNAAGVDLDELTLWGELEHISPMKLLGRCVWIVGVRARAYRDQHMSPILSEDYISGPVSATAKLRKPWQLRDDRLSLSR